MVSEAFFMQPPVSSAFNYNLQVTKTATGKAKTVNFVLDCRVPNVSSDRSVFNFKAEALPIWLNKTSFYPSPKSKMLRE